MVPDIRILGFALRLRWEWQRRAADAPAWTQLPSKTEKLVSIMFSCSVVVELGDGASARFWSDSWLPAGPIASFAPHLLQAIGRCFLKVSVKESLSGCHWVRHITGVHTAPVLYVDLWEKRERSVYLAMDAGWHLLCVLGISLVLPGYFLLVGSQGALEGLGAAKSEAFLLVSSTRSHLDDRS